MEETNLQPLKEEMFAFAKEHPMFFGEIVNDGCLQFINIDNLRIRLILSLNIYPIEPKCLWHLSISSPDLKSILPEETVDKVAAFFFGENRIKVDAPWLPERDKIKQFIKIPEATLSW